MELGTLYCVCISRIKELPEIELKVFAVRKRIFLPDGWVHWDSIAPSKALLDKAKQMERMNEWNETAYREFYEPKFRYEIQHRNSAKQDLSTIVRTLKSGRNVAVACYCGNHQMCHRGIIGEIFEKIGYSVFYN